MIKALKMHSNMVCIAVLVRQEMRRVRATFSRHL